MGEGAASDRGPQSLDRICPWCSTDTERVLTRCPRCGAALAQRETIDGLTIPGLTDVSPALEGDSARTERS